MKAFSLGLHKDINLFESQKLTFARVSNLLPSITSEVVCLPEFCSFRTWLFCTTFFLWKCSFLSSIQTHPLDTFICHFIKSFLWLKSVMKVFELLTKTCHSAVNFLYSFPISVIFDNKTKKERRKDLSILKVLSKFFSIKKISFENFRNLCWE